LSGIGWLELLKETAPDMTRVAVLRDPGTASGIGQFAALQSVASGLRVELGPVDVRDAAEIERDITAFARTSAGGLIVTGSPSATAHRELITALAARHKLPAVYAFRFFVTAGGLISYGPDTIDQYRRGAFYVDRIFKGEKSGDLPVQAPTKYELETAKALGLEVPATVLARADGDAIAPYSSDTPNTFPVFGLTKCTCWHARHVNEWYASSSISDTSSAIQPCTR
jgi:putative tryptophan/tyrosine transport system substrate-binding protein